MPKGMGSGAKKATSQSNPTGIARKGARLHSSAGSSRPRSRARKTSVTKTAEAPAAERKVSLKAFALTLTLVVALLGVTQPLHQWWAQQREYRSVLIQIEQAKQTNAELQDQLDRWGDKSYVASQARARLQYVQPGETQYQVLDAPGIADGMADTKPVEDQGPPRPWYLVVADTADAADDVNQPVRLDPSVRLKKNEE